MKNILQGKQDIIQNAAISGVINARENLEQKYNAETVNIENGSRWNWRRSLHIWRGKADDEYKSEVSTFCEICVNCGIPYLTERSRSGKGAHVWIFFGHPISAGTARLLGNLLLMKGANQLI